MLKQQSRYYCRRYTLTGQFIRYICLTDRYSKSLISQSHGSNSMYLGMKNGEERWFNWLWTWCNCWYQTEEDHHHFSKGCYVSENNTFQCILAAIISVNMKKLVFASRGCLVVTLKSFFSPSTFKLGLPTRRSNLFWVIRLGLIMSFLFRGTAGSWVWIFGVLRR